ncbi:hypothetical protein J3458_003485 [Metarhizium acridum]|uniref:uncharacterized protein n=1 Tax=Metarhizium acridum TaxID=92637 RepID=UPI001C6D0A1E|nr:hypothetical protein J3458_003485 [Metarhizium acridum]
MLRLYQKIILSTHGMNYTQMSLGLHGVVDGQQPFPPGRLDKVGLVGLRPYHIEVMHPGVIDLGSNDGNRNTSVKDTVSVCNETGLVKPSDQIVPWSDHSGLKCSVELVGE